MQKEKIKEQAALLRERDRQAHEKRTEERIRWLVDAMPLCVWATAATGEAYYCNAVWSEFSGLDAPQSATIRHPRRCVSSYTYLLLAARAYRDGERPTMALKSLMKCAWSK